MKARERMLDESIEKLQEENRRLRRDAKKLVADLGGLQPFISAAVSWWASKRPLDYSLNDHIRNPWVNCAGPAERHLALMVSELQGRNFDV